MAGFRGFRVPRFPENGRILFALAFVKDLEIYNAKLKEQGLEEDKPLKLLPGLPAGIQQELATFLKNIDVKEEAKKQLFWSWPWFRSQVALDWRYISLFNIYIKNLQS